MNAPFPTRHAISRVRRETRLRRLEVCSVERLTPNMQRIVLASDDLHDFESLSPDDHVKLFLPGDGGPQRRDYTPRAFDAAKRRLTLDFALHEAGPATAWALAAQPGEVLEVGGPRGSNVVADDFDWYLLVGDETALPAIGRRLEELRPGVPVSTFVVLDQPEDRQAIATRTVWTSNWVVRDGSGRDDGALLRAALDGYVTPPGDGYVWIAAEAQAAKQLRRYMLEDRGHPAAWLKASGYWVRGEAGVDKVNLD